MKYWYDVYYRNGAGEMCRMKCKGAFASEAEQEASERLEGDDAEILRSVRQEPVFPSTYHNQTIDGLPRRARR